MTADKMFKELFYEQRENNIDYVYYMNRLNANEITFWKRKREIVINTMLNVKLLKAINEKCKELGWLDDKC
jgi:hypothetical protein